MLVPVKNGTVLYLAEYHAYTRCDPYRLDGYGWAFRINNTFYWGNEGAVPDITVHEITHRFDEFAPHGTIIVKDRQCRLEESFKEAMCEAGI